nr:twin-arginine translocase subunit TatC [Desulfobacterales bacterium]
MQDEVKLPFTDHLEELRRRLIICLVAVGIGFIVSYMFSKKLFAILVIPLLKTMPPGEEQLIFTGLPEAFFTYLKVSLMAGILLATPVILYQLWMFIAPGLYENERRLVLPIVIFSSIFFLGGTLFAYFVILPIGFKFFIGFSCDYLRPMPTIREYLSFSSKLLLAFGVIFEMPLFILFLSKLGLITAEYLVNKRKYAILLFFIFGAILTPPDVITQVLMALPLIVLYEVSILIAKIFGKKEEEEIENNPS